MSNLRYIIFIAIMLLITGSSANNTETVCPILTHTKNITINNIMGTWYAVRGIEHTELSTTTRQGSTKDCRSLDLNQNDQSEVIFQWSKANQVRLRVNAQNPNLWHSISQSTTNGLPVRTVQVTEVDDKHIVITVCFSLKRISSAVLNREPIFNEQQVIEATTKLKNQGLKSVETFDRCQK